MRLNLRRRPVNYDPDPLTADQAYGIELKASGDRRLQARIPAAALVGKSAEERHSILQEKFLGLIIVMLTHEGHALPGVLHMVDGQLVPAESLAHDPRA